MLITRRGMLQAGAGSAVLTVGSGSPIHSSALTPEQFGARGDGRTNDTDAFAALAGEINRRGGGTINLRRTTYLVGKQRVRTRAGYAFAPTDILNFLGCRQPLLVRGNGARLMCASGLKYGTFNSAGEPTRHAMPYYGSGELASPYVAMIRVTDCTASIEITDLELDGNLAELEIGGPFGDQGWQIGAAGIVLLNNKGIERLAHIHSHHHAQDGITIDGSPERSGWSMLEDITCEYNVRQGCSLVGGSNYEFRRCQFNHTGKMRIMSPPGAGVDVEAEGKTIRRLTFVDCDFSNNSGPGLLADSGNTEGAVFERCRFIGTTSWSAWPRMPRFRFKHCDFVGALVAAYGNKDPDRAAQFRDCVFRDDPRLSPTGQVYDIGSSHPIAELPYSENVLFDRCRFELTDKAVLPWSLNVIFVDCLLSQASTKVAYPRGTFLGRNTIKGPVDLYGSRIVGELVVNGKRISPTR